MHAEIATAAGGLAVRRATRDHSSLAGDPHYSAKVLERSDDRNHLVPG